MFEPLLEHIGNTVVDSLAQFVPAAFHDDGFDVEGAGSQGLVDDLAVGFADGEADLQCPLEADAVGEIDLPVVFGVEGKEHLLQALNPFVAKFLLQLGTQFG